jgi:hypothetical protein
MIKILNYLILWYQVSQIIQILYLHLCRAPSLGILSALLRGSSSSSSSSIDVLLRGSCSSSSSSIDVLSLSLLLLTCWISSNCCCANTFSNIFGISTIALEADTKIVSIITIKWILFLDSVLILTYYIIYWLKYLFLLIGINFKVSNRIIMIFYYYIMKTYLMMLRLLYLFINQ